MKRFLWLVSMSSFDNGVYFVKLWPDKWSRKFSLGYVIITEKKHSGGLRWSLQIVLWTIVMVFSLSLHVESIMQLFSWPHDGWNWLWLCCLLSSLDNHGSVVINNRLVHTRRGIIPNETFIESQTFKFSLKKKVLGIPFTCVNYFLFFLAILYRYEFSHDKILLALQQGRGPEFYQQGTLQVKLLLFCRLFITIVGHSSWPLALSWSLDKMLLPGCFNFPVLLLQHVAVADPAGGKLICYPFLCNRPLNFPFLINVCSSHF